MVASTPEASTRRVADSTTSLGDRSKVPTSAPGGDASDRDTDARIVAAMERIIGGTCKPEHADPTIVNLAREAGVGRATVNRKEDLKERFARMIDDALASEGRAVNPAIRVGQLERVSREQRKRIGALQAENAQMAQQLLYITERYRRLAAKGDGAAPSPGVTPIESRMGGNGRK